MSYQTEPSVPQPIRHYTARKPSPKKEKEGTVADSFSFTVPQPLEAPPFAEP